MTRTGFWRGTAGAMVVVFALASVVAAQSQDPRASRIKQRLERIGLKVLDLGFAPAKGTASPVWIVLTAASYDRPSWGRVSGQTSTIWNVMFSVLNAEAANTLFTVGQDWSKYRLLFSTQLRHLTEFDTSIRAAKTDADGQKAVEVLWKTVVFRVYDVQKQKLVDEKEFMSMYFVKD